MLKPPKTLICAPLKANWICALDPKELAKTGWKCLTYEGLALSGYTLKEVIHALES